MDMRRATTYVDYQQRASEFSAGDLVFPIEGPYDQSYAGRVVALYPAIGMADVEFANGSKRYPVEDLQRATNIDAIPPAVEHNSIPGGSGTVGVSVGPAVKQASSNDQELTRWALKAFDNFRDGPVDTVDNRFLSESVAITVGNHAARKGIPLGDVRKWLQSAYGSVWVRQTDLNPGLDLKDVWKLIEKTYVKRAGARVAGAFLKKSLYWASRDRHYKATSAELESGTFTCPRCKDQVLRPVSYKRSEGQSVRLFGCHGCLFLIKPCDIIGHPEYEDDGVDGVEIVAAESKQSSRRERLTRKDAARPKGQVIVWFDLAGWSRGSHPELEEGETWDDVAQRFARDFKSYLGGWLRQAFMRAVVKGRGRFEILFEVSPDQVDFVEEEVEKVLERIGQARGYDSEVYSRLVFGLSDYGRMPRLTVEEL